MKIILFRHAEKAYSTSNNPPLSERGNQQANRIAELISAGKIPRPDVLLCSPKIRTFQTLLPVSALLKIEIKQMKELDERLSTESSAQYFQRVQNTISWLGHQKSNVLLVTHFDWLEEAMTAIPCDTDLNQEKYHAWGSAHYMNFSLNGDVWQLNDFSGVDL